MKSMQKVAISKFVSRADNAYASDTKYVSRKTRAVVLGASIAGLFAGRVLANYFDEVILIDKEELDEGAVARKAVPQGNHVHVIFTPTYAVLQDFFPGLVDDLVSHGVSVQDAGRDAPGIRERNRHATDPARLQP